MKEISRTYAISPNFLPAAIGIRSSRNIELGELSVIVLELMGIGIDDIPYTDLRTKKIGELVYILDTSNRACTAVKLAERLEMFKWFKNKRPKVLWPVRTKEGGRFVYNAEGIFQKYEASVEIHGIPHLVECCSLKMFAGSELLKVYTERSKDERIIFDRGEIIERSYGIDIGSKRQSEFVQIRSFLSKRGFRTEKLGTRLGDNLCNIIKDDDEDPKKQPSGEIGSESFGYFESLAGAEIAYANSKRVPLLKQLVVPEDTRLAEVIEEYKAKQAAAVED